MSPTLWLASSTSSAQIEHVYGGYTRIPWKKIEKIEENAIHQDDKAFIFNLYPHQKKYTPVQNREYAVRHYKDLLIGFGKATDILIRENCDKTFSNISHFGKHESTYTRSEPGMDAK